VNRLGTAVSAAREPQTVAGIGRHSD
jgi:hypothetical protein